MEQRWTKLLTKQMTRAVEDDNTKSHTIDATSQKAATTSDGVVFVVCCVKQKERSVQLLYVVVVVFPIAFSEGFVVDSTRLLAHVILGTWWVGLVCGFFVAFVLAFVEASFSCGCIVF